MARLLSASICMAACLGSAWGQSWTCGSGSCTTTGNVGIGTTSPAQALSVGSSSQFTVSSAGAVVTSAGISSPQGTNSERLGAASTASSISSVAIGYNAHADYDGSVTIGRSASAAAANSVQVGYISGAGADGTAVGFGANATTGGGGTALGRSAVATGVDALALGMSSSASAHGTAAVGFSAAANGEYDFAGGYGAHAQGGGSVALGAFATTHSTDTGSVAMGYQASTTTTHQFVAGGPYWYINDIYFGRGVSSATPVGVTINANGGQDTTTPTPNIAGGSLTLAAGKGSGTASGGDLLFATSDPTTSGTTLQSLSTKLIVKDNGRVGIGTITPQHLLSVAGTIGAQEVVVVSSGADYVFGPGYNLAPLSDVSAYVKENQHLPGIPSAAEVREKGLSVGEMQTRLLEKIEELTLHMIQMDETNHELRKEIDDLRKAANRGASE